MKRKQQKHPQNESTLPPFPNKEIFYKAALCPLIYYIIRIMPDTLYIQKMKPDFDFLLKCMQIVLREKN